MKADDCIELLLGLIETQEIVHIASRHVLRMQNELIARQRSFMAIKDGLPHEMHEAVRLCSYGNAVLFISAQLEGWEAIVSYLRKQGVPLHIFVVDATDS